MPLKELLLEPGVSGYSPLRYARINVVWRHEYWGASVHTPKGQNMMGQLLMELRAEYLREPEGSLPEGLSNSNDNNDSDEYAKQCALSLIKYGRTTVLAGITVVSIIMLMRYLLQQDEEVTE